MKFAMKKETADAVEKRELVKKLVVRRYGEFGGEPRRQIFEASLADQPLETLRSMEKMALELEVRERQRRSERNHR
jgi:hypothetical protein